MMRFHPLTLESILSATGSQILSNAQQEMVKRHAKKNKIMSNHLAKVFPSVVIVMDKMMLLFKILGNHLNLEVMSSKWVTSVIQTKDSA